MRCDAVFIRSHVADGKTRLNFSRDPALLQADNTLLWFTDAQEQNAGLAASVDLQLLLGAREFHAM